jgi:coproporphyrinogen III oxidase-like Fe-S oxidoreductase
MLHQRGSLGLKQHANSPVACKNRPSAGRGTQGQRRPASRSLVVHVRVFQPFCVPSCCYCLNV